MTVFGKLLVFMNLVFSVVIGALIIFVFTTRANWQTAYEEAKKQAEAAEAAYNSEKTAHDNDLKQKNSTADGLNSEVDRLKTDLAAAQTATENANKALATQVNKTNQAVFSQTAAGEELKQMKVEREIILKEKDDLRNRIVNMQKEVDDWRNKAINSDLQAKNLVQKNNNLLRQVEELVTKNRELEAAGALVGSAGAGAAGTGLSIVDPPVRSAPAGVRGKVTGIGKTGTGLAQIDIGSDSGLSPGNVLTVYLGTEYKGDLLLTTVMPKTAVGKFTPARRTSVIMANDNVITSFTGAGQ